jgi:chitinase
MPFYGRSNPDGSLSDWMSYASISSLIENNKYKYVWDDVAKEPYLVNSTGVMECSFEDEKSIAEKCKYIKNKKMKGIMYWQYDGDDAKGTLRKAIYDGMLK